MNRNNREDEKSRRGMRSSIKEISKNVDSFFTWCEFPNEETRDDIETIMDTIIDEIDYLRIEMESLDSYIANGNAWIEHLRLGSIMREILDELDSGMEMDFYQLEALHKSAKSSIKILAKLVKNAGPGLTRPLCNIHL